MYELIQFKSFLLFQNFLYFFYNFVCLQFWNISAFCKNYSRLARALLQHEWLLVSKNIQSGFLCKVYEEFEIIWLVRITPGVRFYHIDKKDSTLEI